MFAMQTVTPLEPLLQRMDHIFYAKKDMLKFFGKTQMYAFNGQVKRDVLIWNRKVILRNPILKNDGPIMKFRTWFKQFYPAEKQDEKPKTCKDFYTLDW